MATRKYISEGCLNMFCPNPILIQRHRMNDPKFLEMAKTIPFHIYMICRRPRITFDPASIVYGDKKMTARFIVHAREGQISVPFTTSMSIDDPSKRPIKCEFAYNEVRILDENGELVVGFHASHMMSMTASDLHDYSQMKHLDLEVLYVGQAYGKDGERTAPDRLQAHETLLAIYAELAANAPEDDIWLALLSFEPPITIMSFDGRKQAIEVTGDADLAHMFNMIDNPVTERQRICFAEAGLIRYFQPKYNDKFKYNFPNPSHDTYSQCYDLDYNAVSVEIHFEGLRMRMYSPTVGPVYNVMAEFPLHNPEQRRSMFDVVL